MKIKIFTSYDLFEIENQINLFLKENGIEAIDIKHMTCVDEYASFIDRTVTSYINKTSYIYTLIYK